MMKYFAVDTVLLPPQPLIEIAARKNAELLQNNRPAIMLGKDTIPHISLSMGVIARTDIERYQKELEKIGNRFKPLALKVTSIYSKKIENGEYLSSMQIESTESLYDLHRAVMELNPRYFDNELQKQWIYRPNEVEVITLSFIQGYAKSSAYGNFSPHITLGLGVMDDPSFQYEFTADTLALYHLGNYCTCRTELARTVII